MEKRTNFMKVGDKVNIDCGDYVLYGKIAAFECEMYIYCVEFTDINGEFKALHVDVENVANGTVKLSDLRVEA